VTATLGRDPEDPSIEVLGWSIADMQYREQLPAMRAHQKAHLQVALRIGNKGGAPIQGHCTFVHIDHTPTRYGNEHRDHQSYPISLWHAGDIIIDDFEVDLPPHFGRGTYPLYWGVGVLPCQDDQRMPIITTGSAHNDGHHRLNLGRLEVR
jgi:hypothetical protein